MVLSDSGGIPKRMILIQLVIIAGLIGFIEFYLPHMEKSQAAARLAQRENHIEQFFNSIVGDSNPGAQSHSLRSTPSMQEVEQRLGPPETGSTDFRGGLHLTWTGTRHSLQCSFYKGQLYYLTFTNRTTGEIVTASAPSAAGF